MPVNNIKVMSETTLAKFKEKYLVTYDKDADTITVTTTSIRKTTTHDANKSFHINSRGSPKRKVSFTQETIDLWKAIVTDEKTKNVTIFDVQNAIVKLRVMYQQISKEKIVEMCTQGFNGVKRC